MSAREHSGDRRLCAAPANYTPTKAPGGGENEKERKLSILEKKKITMDILTVGQELGRPHLLPTGLGEKANTQERMENILSSTRNGPAPQQ